MCKVVQKEGDKIQRNKYLQKHETDKNAHACRQINRWKHETQQRFDEVEVEDREYPLDCQRLEKARYLIVGLK